MGRVAEVLESVNQNSSNHLLETGPAPKIQGAGLSFCVAGLDEWVALGHSRISGRSGSALVVVLPDGVRVMAGHSPDRPPGGGLRGPITGFSVASRRRLRRVLMATPWDEFAAPGKRSKSGRAFFVSLTYPAEYPATREAKEEKRAWAKRIKRVYPGARFLWKLEEQERGAPHFHAVVLLADVVSVAAFRREASAAWCAVVDSGDQWHSVYGADAGVVYGSGRQLVAYMLKYLGKEWVVQSDDLPGRVWGHSVDWPQRVLAAFYVSGPDYVKLIRRVRRWGRRSRFLASRRVRASFDVMGRGVGLAQLLRGLYCVSVDGVAVVPP